MLGKGQVLKERLADVLAIIFLSLSYSQLGHSSQFPIVPDIILCQTAVIQRSFSEAQVCGTGRECYGFCSDLILHRNWRPLRSVPQASYEEHALFAPYHISTILTSHAQGFVHSQMHLLSHTCILDLLPPKAGS